MAEKETFFFRGGEKTLYGALYSPSPAGEGSGDIGGGGRGLIICDSLFEEKFWCERVFSNLARILAAAGIPVLMFDYYGYGNSAGESKDIDVSGLEKDIDDACTFMRDRGAERITLLGIRWGAALACRAAARREEVDSVILIQAIADWEKELMKALRSNVAGQYAIFKKAVMTREEIVNELLAGGDCVRSGYLMNNIEGYVLSRDFLEQARKVRLPLELPARVELFTIFQIPERHGSPPPQEGRLAAAFRDTGVDCEDLTIREDNAFWINNRIFTSVTPHLYREISSRLAGLARSGPGKRSPGGTDSRIKTDLSPFFINDGVREETISFISEGNQIDGVLYLPQGKEPKETALVFTHGGLIGMNGAFRFNTRAARRFARAGHPCLCCDTRGLGKSGGTMENMEQRVLFRWITTGLFAPDVGEGAALLRDRSGAREIVLFGVCGGAITNIIAHSRYRDVNASILLSIPVMLPSLSYEEVRMSEGYARFYLGLYARKLFNPRAWWRFITFQSENEKIFKSLQVALGAPFKKLRGGKKDPSALTPADARQKDSSPAEKVILSPPTGTGTGQVKSGLSVTVPGAGDNLQFNDVYLKSYREIIDRRERIFFVFGEHDNFKWEFNSEFVEGRSADFNSGRDLVTVEEFTHANHMYTLREWQDRVIDRCLAWVQERGD
ncbi:MAG: alpha/beta fold hydrolase [Candidatus Krumholzibacteriota bacterium]|nr:alpha/beta fold hydrolase [Candidatus Krumholzibacteriota bacterium]